MAGAALNVTVTALDANNNQTSSYTGTVHFTSTDPSSSAVLPANYTFTSGTGGTQLSDSGGPGFQFLTITDTQTLEGKVIFVRRLVGSANSQFSLTIE